MSEIAAAVADLLPKGMILIVITPSEKIAGSSELSLGGARPESSPSSAKPSSGLNGPEDADLLSATYGTPSAPIVVPAPCTALCLVLLSGRSHF